MTSPFKLRELLASDSAADPEDVLQTKAALRKIGVFDPPKYGMNSYPDAHLFNSIRTLQRIRGLPETGRIRPGDETEDEIDQILEKIRVSGRSPIIRCSQCGAPHGGSMGPMCPDCTKKNS